MSELGEYMTTKEVAKMLKIHPSTAGQMAQTGRLRGRKIGVAWAIEKASVDALVKEREVNTAGYTMTTKEVAAKLNLKPKTVIHLCAQGDLDARKDGNLWLIAPESVTAYQNRKQQAEPVAKPKPRPRPVAKQQARQEPTPWQARPAFDWTASVRARWEDVLHAAVSKYRGPGQ